MTTVLRECFETLREGWISSHWPVIVAATTTDVEKVPTGVLGLFKEEIALEASEYLPTYNARCAITDLAGPCRPPANLNDWPFCDDSLLTTSSHRMHPYAPSLSRPPLS